MKQHVRSKQTSAILSVLTLVAIAAIAPHAFAQDQSGQGQQSGISLGSSYGSNPVPAPATMDATMAGWAAMLVIVGITSGIGVYTAVRKH